jgi:hypothetical protein
VPVDHLDRGPAVVGEALDIVAPLEGRRDERVARGIELPWPNCRRAESAVPVLLDEAFFVDRSPGRGRQHEVVGGEPLTMECSWQIHME